MQTPLGITMGCPAGIGAEILLKYVESYPSTLNEIVVIGDYKVLLKAQKQFNIDIKIHLWHPTSPIRSNHLNIYSVSNLETNAHVWGAPDKLCGEASAKFIKHGVKLIQNKTISGIVTCPISKAAINSAGYNFPGHTEMLASLTNTQKVVMMMAGTSLRVTLATIHCALSDVPNLLTAENILQLIQITHQSLRIDFGKQTPKIAVAGLNPHAGEDKLFGDEEVRIITPAIDSAKKEGLEIDGPFPPDTVFFKAARGEYDAVVCMYHDQGLIPFKLLHFEDGVNVTLGLPIVRTSVDHGTAYDIAGKGIANFQSLKAATELAKSIVNNRQNSI